MSGSTIGAAGTPRREIMRKRMRNVALAVPFIGTVSGTAATQMMAWKLRYHPALGQPIFGHIYWPWDCLFWANAAWSAHAQIAISDGKSAALSVGCLCAGGALMLGVRKKPVKHEALHGTARFAKEREVRDAGLLPLSVGGRNPGLYVGGWERRGGIEYLRHEGAQHLLGVAPMRSGKTLGLVVPNLVSWMESAIIYDPKDELWGLTAGWRSQEAKNIVLRWDIASLNSTIAYNFIEDCVRLGTDHEYADMANLIEAVVDPDGKGLEGHFDPSAADSLTGVALHVCYEMRAKRRIASLADVLNAIKDPDRKPEALFKSMIENKHLNGRRHDFIARSGAGMMGKDVKERSGIVSTMQRMLRQLNDPILARNTSRCDFRIADLMDSERPVSLYIVLREQDRLRLRPLFRLFLNQMMDRLCSAPMVPGKAPHLHPLLLMLDEFPTLGRMESFISSLAVCPGYGIRAFLLVQSREQMVLEYTEGETVTGMCHIRIAYAPNTQKTAEWVSDMAGKSTENTEDISESTGSGKPSTSRSYHSTGRNLLNPDEVSRLKQPARDPANPNRVVAPGHSLVMMTGEFPILAAQSLYFMDEEFLRRTALTAPKTSEVIQRAPVQHKIIEGMKA